MPRFNDRLWLEEDYQELDAGIRFAVRVLHAAGFETCQSCQGGKGHAYPQPTIDLMAGGDDAIGFGALNALQQYGLPVDTVSIVWNIQHGLPYERLWRITFSRTLAARADEIPQFVWGYKVNNAEQQ